MDQRPEIVNLVENYSGEGVYSFTESVQVSSTDAQDPHHWTSTGCNGKLSISRNKDGQMEATIAGVLTRPHGRTVIPSSIKGSFSIIPK